MSGRIRFCIVVMIVLVANLSVVQADTEFRPTRVSIPAVYQAGGEESGATFLLSATEEGAPMPRGSVNGERTVKLEGSGEIDFGSLTFERPDAFMYSIDRKEKGENLDSTHFDVFIAVLADGEKVLVIKKEGQKEKPARIEYTDKDDKNAKSPRTGDMLTLIPYLASGGTALIIILLLFILKRNLDNEFKRLLNVK